MGKNLHGGNKSKRMKNSQAAEKPDVHEICNGQMIGRVLKLLGDRQAQVYCNDNVERLCRIRGKLKKRVWIGTGDIVLISLRTFTEDMEDDDDDNNNDSGSNDDNNDFETSSAKKGDILAKYDPDVFSKLKRMDGINRRLFGALDSVTKDFKDAKDDEGDDLFDDDGADADVVDGSAAAAKGEEVPVKRTPWSRASAKVQNDDDEIDIDAI